jgi:hypothetical protein
MSLQVTLPTKFVMSLPGIEVSSYIPLSNPEQVVQCLEDNDTDYLDYLLDSQYCITFPSQLCRDFDFTADYSGMIIVYMSSSPIRDYLRRLCFMNNIPFNEV